jgi:multidrug efflux pump subunit AcrA (membrane-fusion protein)
MDTIHVHRGLNVEIPALKKSFSASLRQIIATTDPASRTFEARLALANPQRELLPGMFGRVKLPQTARERLLIPTSSLVQRGGLEGVFLAGEKAQFRIVKAGEVDQGQVEIFSGLSPQDKVILSPPNALQEGSLIQATPATQP